MVYDDELQAYSDLVAADLAATLGGEHTSRVQARVRELRSFVRPGLGEQLVEDIQQQIHDERICTTWPTCPLHGTHPLWVHDGQWVCERAGAPIAPVGGLRTTQERTPWPST
jgi:hypothetical protein